MSNTLTEAMRKVTAFIVRQRGSQREILTFAHPTAGIQLPAGTVEEGESFEDAVVREAQEETGLNKFQLLRRLAISEYDLPENEYIFLRSSLLFSSPSLTAEPVASPLHSDSILPRAVYVTRNTSEGSWSHVTYAEYNLNVSPPVVEVSVAGWVPSSLLTPHIVRHFFLLTSSEESPETWEHWAEGRHLFRLFWQPLIPKPQLLTGHDEWLDLVYDQLLDAPIS